MRLWVIAFVVTGLMVCGAEVGAQAPAQGSSGGGKKAAAARVKGDFSTPRAAVETFFAAAAARDADLLSRCFASNAPKEFDKLRKKQLSKRELNGMAEDFGGGKVIGVGQDEQRGETRVAVRLRSRDERISMVKTAGGWKILDF